MRLALKGVTFFFFFFKSLDIHELWHSVMSICLFTEVKWHYVSTGTGVSVGISLCRQIFINSSAPTRISVGCAVRAFIPKYFSTLSK